MVYFEINIDIEQPPEIVDKALLNHENAVYWTTDLEEFEVVKGKPGEVGSVARLHYVQKGQKHTMEDVLEYSEPGKRYKSRVSGPAITARVETNIEPTKKGTKLTISWTGTGKKLLVKILLPMLGSKIKAQAQKELETFKNLVETHGPDFSKSQKKKVQS
jgi:hypothetical protein